jgi:deaminated glutathione amidase
MKVAAIQLSSTDSIAENIAQTTPLLEEAVSSGAQLIATPENTFLMRHEGMEAPVADGPTALHAGVRFIQEFAKTRSVWVLIGSIRAREAGMEKPFNRSVLVNPKGEITATYDKIHLFDVTLAGGKAYRESAQLAAGGRAVVTPVEGWQLGLSICYDLRFPALYQTLSAQGATLLAVPSAFTRPTGKAHWHTLLKARAIENAAYVIAPAQSGAHPGGRETFGHSLIIDPWGVVVAEAQGDGPQVLMAEIDAARVSDVRAQIPVIAHRRVVE